MTDDAVAQTASRYREAASLAYSLLSSACTIGRSPGSSNPTPSGSKVVPPSRSDPQVVPHAGRNIGQTVGESPA